jgi:hypothetical protein
MLGRAGMELGDCARSRDDGPQEMFPSGRRAVGPPKRTASRDPSVADQLHSDQVLQDTPESARENRYAGNAATTGAPGACAVRVCGNVVQTPFQAWTHVFSVQADSL